MKKNVKLKDGTKVLIKSLTIEDLDNSVRFFRALPEEDRAYLRVDVTKRDIVRKRIETIEPAKIVRLVAVYNNEIIADGALEFEADTWKKHVAELRLIVARPFQHKGLGTLLAHELFSIALNKKVEDVVVKFMGPQVRPRRIFKKLGFHQDAVLRGFVKDIKGQKQDLVIMRCDIDSVWLKIEDLLVESEYRGRWQCEK